TRDRRPSPEPVPPRRAGSRIPARLPVRPPRLEPAGGQPGYLRRLRLVPQGIPPRDRRVPHGERGRGPRSRRTPAPLSAAAQATLRNSLHSRSGGVDRGPRVRADPVTSAGAVAPRPDRRDVAVQGHALQPPV